MNSFFEKLGQTVLERWRQQNFSLEAFPELARIALDEAPPSHHVNVEEMMQEFLSNDAQPFQSQSGFGQPELVAFNDSRFYIQILFWLEGTTEIHQHEFSGAFHVMQGSSVHSEFEFEEAHVITPHIRTGALKVKDIELLEKGRTIPITSGRECIHSLFHLDTPSVTVVVRTHHDPGTGPQYNYLPPHVAVDPMQADALTTRRMQLLDVLEALDDLSYVKQVKGMVESLDFERGFHTLRYSMGRLEHFGEWDATLTLFEKKHGDLAKGVPETLAECRRRDAISQLRYHISHPEHRFFLALLMNVQSREAIEGLILKRFPDQSADERILAWLLELIEPTEFGLTLLDFSFPDSLAVPVEDQFEILVEALKELLNGKGGNESLSVEQVEIQATLRNSCLQVLLR